MSAEPYDRDGIAALLDWERVIVMAALLVYGDITLAAERLDVPGTDLVEALKRWRAIPCNTTAHWRQVDLEEAA